MDKPDAGAQPDAASNSVDPAVSPQPTDPGTGGQVPFSYATPGIRAPLSAPARVVAFVLGFCAGALLVTAGGFFIGLFYFESRRSEILPAILFYLVFITISFGVTASLRRSARLLTRARWFTLGLLFGGGLTCLVEGTCFAFNNLSA